MRANYSLRQRVALGIAILSILIVSAHSVAIYLITDDQEEAQIDELVGQEVESLLARYRENPQLAPLQTRYLASYIARNAQERDALPPYLHDLAPGMHEVLDQGREWHVAVRALGDARLYLAYDAEPHEQRLREFRWLLIFGVVITALAAAALGYALASLLTRPVADLAARVGRLSPNAPAPVAARYRDEEVYRLAQAFDEYSARMAQFVAREQEFTAGVSHELRTPLTAIRTGCELLLADTRLSADARQRVERIQRAAGQMSELTHSLLLLARAGASPEPEPVALRECVADVAEPLAEMAAAQATELRNRIGADVAVCVDRGALNVVLANLLRNAIAHTTGGSVEVRARDGALEIEDTGGGIAPEDMPRVFERFYRGRGAQAGAGHGLGLAIVKHLVDQQHWRLTLDSEPGRGTRAVLRFPESAWLHKN